MNSKIIFWMNDALSFVGVPKTLQEKYGFEIFGIFDVTDKSKKFLAKQKLINFSKIWFFHDHVYKTNKKPDKEYLKSIEKKYKVDLGLLASNERFFNKFNQFYKFSPDEILLILEQECKLFEKILDEVKPDFLITPMTTLHHNHLFYEICKARKIRILMIRSSFLISRYIISEEFHLIGELNNAKHNFESFEHAQTFLKDYDSNVKLEMELNANSTSSKIIYFKAILKFLFSKNTNPKTHFTYYGRTKFTVLVNTVYDILKTKYRKFFINKNLIRTIDNEKPIIYFPLQIEPERSLLITAPKYTNQIQVIRNIANVLPKGYELYVKEHPNAVVRSWHSVSFYKEIMSLSNTKLIHPSVKSKDLIKKSSLIITISSTTGIEATFYKKPSIIFSDLDFSIISSVHKIKSINELSSAIETYLKKDVKLSDLNNYVNLIDANSFVLNWDSMDAEFDHIFHYGGHLVDAEISGDKMKLFLEQHSKDFDIISSACNKKIQSYTDQ